MAGPTATLKTNKGDIVVELFPDTAPKTVDNFVGLATGQRLWRHPRTGQEQNVPLYDGTVFHRVIPGFMIQGGDPLGNGTGGPGYEFEDEVDGPHRFDGAGYLAMANAGPGTNGSQFFITEGPQPHLNGRHTIFGKVISGQDVVSTIANVPTDRRDRPVDPVVIESIEISQPQG
jgi:peptidyl-prolyl cis-trans isomerase A (cyclophilin A)